MAGMRVFFRTVPLFLLLLLVSQSSPTAAHEEAVAKPKQQPVEESLSSFFNTRKLGLVMKRRRYVPMPAAGAGASTKTRASAATRSQITSVPICCLLGYFILFGFFLV